MNDIKFRAWLKQHKTMVKVLNLKLETKVVVIWLESSVEGINYGESVSCKLENLGYSTICCEYPIIIREALL